MTHYACSGTSKQRSVDHSQVSTELSFWSDCLDVGGNLMGVVRLPYIFTLFDICLVIPTQFLRESHRYYISTAHTLQRVFPESKHHLNVPIAQWDKVDHSTLHCVIASYHCLYQGFANCPDNVNLNSALFCSKLHLLPLNSLNLKCIKS